ncbi:MAG: hypothetical protein MJ233_03390 [Mycoplasmoidaceae bacterium]|nr:hypothetical protein [Mycoplasmoidaceae bacterium]
MYNEPYDNHAVKINAISDGTVAFRISRKDSKIYTNNYFITYTINDGEAQVYNLSEYEAPLIELKKGDALYVRNYSDYLNQV